MQCFFIVAIFLLVVVVYYGQQLYFRVTERGKVWKGCYRCGGRGSIRSENYGTNGVEIWPLYDTCPTCRGRGKVEDPSSKYLEKNTSAAHKKKTVQGKRKIFGMKAWQVVVLAGMLLIITGALATFVYIVLNM
jgi:hypothetical protein